MTRKIRSINERIAEAEAEAEAAWAKFQDARDKVTRLQEQRELKLQKIRQQKAELEKALADMTSEEE